MAMKIETLAGDGKAFGSGPDNPHGPHLQFELDEQGARGFVTFQDKFQGWPGMVHNGLLVLGLDDAMFFATVNATDSYSMSVELKLSMEQPVLVNEPLIIKAWVDKIDERKVYTKGEIRRGQDNSLLARGQGLYILVKGREEAKASENLANVRLSRTLDS